jgi:hypothetical protein
MLRPQSKLAVAIAEWVGNPAGCGAILPATPADRNGDRFSSGEGAAGRVRHGACVIATAHGPDNAEVTRATVIRLDPTMPLRFVVLARRPSLG